MGDIAKGVLGGAWTLLVGWVLPTALNLSVFFFAVAPTLRHTAPVTRLWPGTRTDAALLLLASSVLLGLVLSALQNPLFRILEGYLLWPERAYRAGCARHGRIKKLMSDRLVLIRLARREAEAPARLTAEDTARLAALRADPRLTAVAASDARRSATQRALLREKLSRYPLDDRQIAPTRLGNAIRRFEEYGYDRFRLDTQVLWNELTGTAPEQIRRQAELARVNVDFFVALLYGHGLVALAAVLSLTAADPDTLPLTVAAVVLCLLIPVWYRCAVVATDEWAAAVRALVNVGRKPLAESLGLRLPADLAAERAMWTLVTRQSRTAYSDRTAALDAYRA
ncbi:hypothetical protein SAMN05216251_107334 [Actinacidiphila alni]|uniref:Uncharacterized protein n=1 Tax=Actinacidiphila alni TaxID=380248 RepID=A0A1I2FHF1_9ACTN|nr:hypothetical protein [Actinacidiphila alni]SFF04178.1 hypothetical protein SAMN05216251_107334 [Actinacidiphila alni]